MQIPQIKDIQKHVESRVQKIISQDEKIHAFVEGCFKEKFVHEQLKVLLSKSEDEISASSLSGYVLGVKDIINTESFPTRCGSNLPEHLFAGKEASCVTKMRKAGCIIAGKTVSTEFAIWHPGKTCNPCNLEHTPGGSSSGSAASVSAGFVDIAFGTQTNGSVIRPAAYCGVVGFKPTFGRIPLDGVIPFCPSTDHLGIFVSKLELLKLVMAQLVQDWKEHTELRDTANIVLGVPIGNYFNQANKDALDNFWKTVEILQNKGIKVKEIPFLDNIASFKVEFEKLIYGELARVHKDWFREYGNLYRPKTAECVITGQRVSDMELVELRERQSRFIEDLKHLMSKEKIDVWIAPSALGTAPKGIKKTGQPAMNSIWSYSRLPAISIKSGINEELNLPYGLQIIGRFNKDEKLLEITKLLKFLLDSSPHKDN